MRREIPYLSVLAAAAPLAVSAPPQHATEIRIAGGGGSYAVVSHGCEGNVITKNRADFGNAALEASHKFPSPVRLGARVGIIGVEGAEDIHYANPYISMDWPSASIGVGFLHGDRDLPDDEEDPFELSPSGNIHQNAPSGHLRFGRPFYVSVSMFEDVPLLASGYGAIGLGHAGRKLHLWAGTGGVPYEHWGFVTKADYAVSGGLSLGATGRLGKAEGISESAFAFGFSYQWAGGAGASKHEPDATPAGSPSAPADSVR
jgi:hypothetical protein